MACRCAKYKRETLPVSPHIQLFRTLRACAALTFLSSASAALGDTVDVYFGTRGGASQGIYHSTLDTESGELGEARLAAGIGDPEFLALHPDGDKLYAVAKLDDEAVVAGYRIGANGDLTRFSTSPVREGNGTHLCVHPSGRLLLTAQYSAGTVAAFPLDAEGKLGNATLTKHEGGSGVVPERQGEPHPHWCGYSPDGRFAFVPDLGLDRIVIYRVDLESQSISPHGYAETIPGGGPRHMRFSVDGRFIYLLNELTQSVTTFRYDAEAGTTERLTTTPALSEDVRTKESFNSAAEILVHPSGRFVYSSNRGHDSVTAYRADPATGQLTVVDVEAIRGAWPRNINMDASGKWLLAAGQHSNTVSVMAIDPASGELTYPTNHVINVPAALCILPVE